MSSEVDDWRLILSDYCERQERSQREASEEQVTAADHRREFLDRTVLPAFRELRGELQRHGRHVDIVSGPWRADLTVRHHGRAEFHAAVKLDGDSALLVLFEEQNGHPFPVEASFAVGMSRPRDVTEEKVLLALVDSYTHCGISRAPAPA